MQVLPWQTTVLSVVGVQQVLWHLGRGAGLTVMHEMKPQSSSLSWQQAICTKMYGFKITYWWNGFSNEHVFQQLKTIIEWIMTFVCCPVLQGCLPLNFSCIVSIKRAYKLTKLAAAAASDSSHGEQRGWLWHTQENHYSSLPSSVL